MNKFTQKIQKGFTLIELLIVIAVLGVLATVVLVAINPLEQLSRGEDSGRKSSVAQLGHAMQAHFTAQNLQVYPACANCTWQTTLQTAGELGQILTAPVNSKGNCSINVQGNYCYQSSGTDAVIWTIIESRSDLVKAGSTCATNPAHFAAATWNARFGKEGLVCLGVSAATQPPYATEPI